MQIFWIILLAVLALGVPAFIVIKTNQSKKRGCGRGCATCKNRFICHPGEYERPGANDAENK